MAIETFKKKKPLNNNLEDFIITQIDFDTKLKKTIGFSAIQIYAKEEQIHEIIRFDTAHGYCHAHRFYSQLKALPEKLPNIDISQKGFDACREDIKNNWEKYKQKYIEKWL